MSFRLTSFTSCLALLASCGAYYTPVSFVAQGDQIIASGTIDETTLSAFEEVIAQNPEARTLVLQYIEGSLDDDANVIFSREVHRAGFDTVVPSNGLVASGGTICFWPETAASCNRGPVSVSTAGPGQVWWRPTCPRTTPNMTDTWTISKTSAWMRHSTGTPLYAAPADSMHWMNTTEANRFGLTTRGAPALGSATECDER